MATFQRWKSLIVGLSGHPLLWGALEGVVQRFHSLRTFDGSFKDVSDTFSKDLLGDVIPYVEARFPVIKDRDHRALAGLSMGGVESLTIGLNHLEIFSYVAGFSAAVRPADFPRDFAALTANPDESNRQLHLLWLGVGRDDGLFGATDSFSKFLDAAKIKHINHTSDGAHTWIVWRRYLQQLTPLIFSTDANNLAH